MGQYSDLISCIQLFLSLLRIYLEFYYLYIYSPYCCFLKLPYPVSPYLYRRILLAVSVLRRLPVLCGTYRLMIEIASR